MKIEFVGGISKELADVIEKNGIDAVCLEGNVCEISDKDFLALKSAAPAAFDGNDIVVVEDESTLEQELIKTGFRYSDNEDGSYNVEYNGYAVTVSEDEEDWCLNYIKTPEGNILPYSEEEYDENFLMGADTGTSYYPKNDYTLESALENLISTSDK